MISTTSFKGVLSLVKFGKCIKSEIYVIYVIYVITTLNSVNNDNLFSERSTRLYIFQIKNNKIYKSEMFQVKFVCNLINSCHYLLTSINT